MCDAIETETKAITILGKTGRQINTIMAENTAAMAAQERAHKPLGPKNESSLPVSKVEVSSSAKTTSDNMIA